MPVTSSGSNRVARSKGARAPRGKNTLDAERLARELLRALRGKRSRPAFSRYLGYRSNVAQRWETGQCWPTAARFFQICARLRLDVPGGVGRFLRNEPEWLRAAQGAPALVVAALLAEVAGKTQLTHIAGQTGYNRYSLGRWFNGSAHPKLPEFLRVLEACSHRVPDFVACFVDPASIPSLSERWRELCSSRELAYTHPISHAVLRALELEGYEKINTRLEQYLARRLAISVEEVEQALSRLEATGQVKKARRGWRVCRVEVVDTGADAARARALKLDWAKLAIRRLESGGAGHSGYNLFSISRRDLARVRDVQLAYVREMQAIIAESKPSECVGLYCALLVDLAVDEENAFAPPSPRAAQERPRVRG